MSMISCFQRVPSSQLLSAICCLLLERLSRPQLEVMDFLTGTRIVGKLFRCNEKIIEWSMADMCEEYRTAAMRLRVWLSSERFSLCRINRVSSIIRKSGERTGLWVSLTMGWNSHYLTFQLDYFSESRKKYFWPGSVLPDFVYLP